MTTEIRVPSLGESLTTATLTRWLKNPDDYVFAGEAVAELETDKVGIEVSAPVSGKLVMGEFPLPEAGQDVEIGQILIMLDENAASPPASSPPVASPSPAMPSFVAESGKEDLALEESAWPHTPKKGEQKQEEPVKMVVEDGVRREKMNRLRQTIARNLKQAQNTAAILTTFNEIDMTEVKALRATYKEEFEQQHGGVRLGFMSFFARAVVEALRGFPVVNAHIEGDEIVYRDHVNLGIAVGTERGLVVPVLHDAEKMSFAELESRIADYGKRARAGRLQLSELAGGSFTITNGGIFGSLLSTPILNVPQSGVLGIHAIQDRPVARNGQVVIRPMMYVALSYDHRLVDGREAVSFLVRVKELVEDPRRLLLGL